MKTTLNQIRACGPCGLAPEKDGERRGLCLLMHTLGKTKTDDAPVSIIQILDSNGLADALWCLHAVVGFEREKRLLAIAFARTVEHLTENPQVLAVLNIAIKFANGEDTQSELDVALRTAHAEWRNLIADEFGCVTPENFTVEAIIKSAEECDDWASARVASAAMNALILTKKTEMEQGIIEKSARTAQIKILRDLCEDIENRK